MNTTADSQNEYYKGRKIEVRLKDGNDGSMVCEWIVTEVSEAAESGAYKGEVNGHFASPLEAQSGGMQSAKQFIDARIARDSGSEQIVVL
jgi:hypothetical protein